MGLQSHRKTVNDAERGISGILFTIALIIVLIFAIGVAVTVAA